MEGGWAGGWTVLEMSGYLGRSLFPIEDIFSVVFFFSLVFVIQLE